MPVSQKLAKLMGRWSIKYKEWKSGKELESGITEIESISLRLEQIKTQFSGFKKDEIKILISVESNIEKSPLLVFFNHSFF